MHLKEEKQLIVDCHINCEDVTLGLALQFHTPFRFYAKKLWCSYGFLESEYSFKNYDVLSLINPNVSFSIYKLEEKKSPKINHGSKKIQKKIT